jgi:signal transduction histidine kinase
MVMRRFLEDSYGRRAWARLLYAIAGAPVGAVGFVFVAATGYVGLGLSVILVGLPVLAAGLTGARVLGAANRWLAARLLGVAVEAPAPVRTGRGFLGWIWTRLGDPDGWRAAVYLLGKGPIGVVTMVVSLGFWVYGLAFVAYPLRLIPAGRDRLDPDDFALGRVHLDTWPRALAVAAVGILLLLAAPWVTRALIPVDLGLVRVLLRRRRTRTESLIETRAHAIDDAAAVRRRVERDLHDGAQAQLVALAMRLGLAKEELISGDTQAALALVDTAHAGAKQALVELRDLARGLHPPALDGGLGPALQSLVAGSAVPVDLRVDLPERPSPAIETIAYFTAAELLANVAKHSRAGRATVSVTRPRDGWLRLTVRDDGVGGARPGSGLAGLTDRVRTVDGRLDLDSPPGGPTVATVDLPVRA